MENRKQFEMIFPDQIRPMFAKVIKENSLVQEIRLRVNMPVIIMVKNQELFLERTGELIRTKNNAAHITVCEMEAVLNHVCRYSLYAFEEELSRGFLTVPGGHRIGVAGKIVCDGTGKILHMKHISYMNIRISHEIQGAADGVIPFLYDKDRFLNSMIISPPGCGKTTILRDIIRQLSDGNSYGTGRSVGVVDERSEIAGCYMGVAQNHVGIRTDILDGCPKTAGMMMLVRSMAPAVVAVDEIGSKEDVLALQNVLRCGSGILVTVHGTDPAEISSKKHLKEIIEEREFKRYIVLEKRNGKCQVSGIYDQDMNIC